MIDIKLLAGLTSRRHLYPRKFSAQLHSKKPGPKGAQREFSGQFMAVDYQYVSINAMYNNMTAVVLDGMCHSRG